MKRSVVLCVLPLLLTTLAACGATIKAPALHVSGIAYRAAGLTGAKLDVSFHVRNVNPDPLVIESFRYTLSLNGEAIGTGYYPTRMELAGMGEQQVVSVFDLNWMSLPPAMQTLLQQENVEAHVAGKYYLAGGSTLKFSNTAQIRLRR